ncbi:MAG: hypothetical protein HYU63_07500, partial [Armatimonadetes bacterium]|nr:hypothetical protein [Armatimonadota bacterium]
MHEARNAARKNIGAGIYFLVYIFFTLIFPLYAQDYFPLDQGNFWIYKTNNGNLIKTEVIGMEKFNDKECILVESFKVEQPQNKQREFYQKINQTIFYYGREFGEFKAYYH